MQYSIRQSFIPSQPTIRASDKVVRYTEVLPTETLQPFIFCYWRLKTTAPLAGGFNYRVVADGCIDIFFSLHKPSESFVMGFCKKYTQFELENSFDYIGVRFLPTMFPQIFKIDGNQLSNRYLNLSDVIPRVAKFIGNTMDQSIDFNDLITKLDTFFLREIKTAHFDWDPRLYNAIASILKHQGTLDIEALDTGISHRQLRRLFQYYIGDTPKTFAKVVRFQNILKAKPSTKSLRENKLFFDAGFFDQSHFIKDFKNFYGVTPTQAFR